MTAGVGNVIHVDFARPDAQRSAVSTTRNPPAAGPLPARYSPRPLRVVFARVARSQLAADIHDHACLIGLLLALAICLAWGFCQVPDLTTGGTP